MKKIYRRSADNADKEGNDGFYESYKGYEVLMRAWFATYAVGLPALVLANDKLLKVFIASGSRKTIVVYFAVAVVIQLLEAIAYKHAMWLVYVGTDNVNDQTAWFHPYAKWLSTAFRLGVVLDVATFAALASGTYLLVQALMNGVYS